MISVPRRLRLPLVILGAALIVILVGTTLLGPTIARGIRDLAAANPSTMQFGPVAGIVKSELGAALTDPAAADATVVQFEVPDGATASDVAAKLQQEGLVKDALAVMYLVVTGGTSDHIAAGTYDLSASMTPQQIVARLQRAPEAIVSVSLRQGLRIEQITAYLQTLGLKMDVHQFYELAMNPPASLRADYPFLATLPNGRSLEGYLGADTYQVYQDVTPEELLRMLLDKWGAAVGDGPIRAAASSGKNFYEVITLASIVEQEAAVDSERPLIAGVYANRIKQAMLLNADPTVIYAWDTVQLGKLPFGQWKDYSFWNPIGTPLAQVELPADLAGYQTYLYKGLVPGPICTPSLLSIEAALAPNTKTGYLYFVAKRDGSHSHAFAKTYAEHQANLKKYGYIK